jgi:hypothetical protein
MQQNEHESKKIIWSALEYEEKERSPDWFWALGIIVVTGALASIIFGNYFFAILLVLAGALLGFYALRDPEMVTYELNIKGLKIGSRLYPFESIQAFWIQADFTPGSPVKPLFFVHSERAVMPVLTIPISLEIAEDIHSFMSGQEVAEVEMQEHPSHKIMDVLGF